MRASVVIGVVMVRVTGVEPAPVAMEAGEKLYVAPDGRPAAVSVIVAGKVVACATGLTVRLKVALVPGTTVEEVGEPATTEKSSITWGSVTVVDEPWLLVSPA